MGTNNGRYSKFQERLKKIVRNRLKRKKKGVEVELNSQQLQKKFIIEKVNEIHNVMSKDDNVKKNTNVANVYGSRNVGKSKNKKFGSINELEENTTFLSDNKIRIDNNYFKDNVRVGKSSDKEQKIEFLGIELINKIKDSFLDKLDRLEVMESELYLLNLEKEGALDNKKLLELKKKIEDLILEINRIIDEYNLYDKKYYMDNFIGLENKIIEDDIINYRELLDSSNKEKDFVKEYKMLDEFKKLYSNLVIIKHDTENLINENEEKIQEFDIRDTKYKNIVSNVCKLDDLQKECLYKINEQNKYLEGLANKINAIEKHEYITSHLKGLGELVGHSLKFIGLKMLSPLSGIIPSIAVNTLMTKKLINDVYNNLHYEDVKHIYYTSVDYDSELSNKIVDINYTEDLINGTLNDIKKLREEFMLQYNSNIPGYSDTLKKINDIENIIYRNQNKVNIVKNKLIKSKKINEDKIIKVKKLNEKMN